MSKIKSAEGFLKNFKRFGFGEIIEDEIYVLSGNDLKEYLDYVLKAKLEGITDVSIVDSDIATIEALHDLLLDAHGYSLDFITLKRARELTKKMYDAMDRTKKLLKDE